MTALSYAQTSTGTRDHIQDPSRTAFTLCERFITRILAREGQRVCRRCADRWQALRIQEERTS